VRRALCIGAAIVMFSVLCAAQADYVGTWAGTWEGGGTGGFVLTLEKAEGGKLGGKVSVTGEPTYEATLKTVSFEGKKMTATYDFTPDPQIVIVLTATFEGNAASGTWTARQSGGTTDVATGTWTVKKK
jgi:hypothetical protein